MNTSSDNGMMELVYRSLTGDLEAEQAKRLNAWLDASPVFRRWYQDLKQTDMLASALTQQAPERVNALVKELHLRIQAETGMMVPLSVDAFTARPVHRVHFLKTNWFRYAAAVVLVAGGVVYSLIVGRRPLTDTNNEQRTRAIADIPPGTNKAILTVGDQEIPLASDKTGVTIGNTIKYSDGSSVPGLTYHLSLITYNSLVTPKGGQYQAALPDGSRLWLNAASSVRFPSKFTGKVREIEVTGEVYLEVAQNSKQPFVVKAAGTEIQVLGTSFNVNAYADEDAVKTTLVDGSVKVKTVEAAVVLKPGQQAVAKYKSPGDGWENQIKVIDNQSEAALAWKNGLFNFNGLNLYAIMRQVERWYDIKVQYEGRLSGITFKGKIDRNITLSEIIEGFDKLGIKVRREGKTLIVSE